MGNRINDISGQKFGRLTAIRPDGRYPSGNIKWLCECECGNFTHTSVAALKKGQSTSCGCYSSERMAAYNTKHGGFGTRLYEIWRQMHRRCYGTNTRAYPLYGGRGITVCEEWQEYGPFRDWALANGYTENLTIDRVDVNGNYTPLNCRWATMKEQANNKRNNHRITYSGETHTVSEWADIYGVNQVKLWDRLSRHDWNIGEALTALCEISGVAK